MWIHGNIMEQLKFDFASRKTKNGIAVYRGCLGCLTDDCPHWNDDYKNNKPDMCMRPQEPWWPERKI